MSELGAMPAFRHHLDDAQIADLVAYLRARFAPDKPAWTGASGGRRPSAHRNLDSGGDAMFH